MELAVIAALIYAHRQSRIVDAESLRLLQQKMELQEHSASARTLLQRALSLCHHGDRVSVRKAEQLVAKLLQIQPNYAQVSLS